MSRSGLLTGEPVPRLSWTALGVPFSVGCADSVVADHLSLLFSGLPTSAEPVRDRERFCIPDGSGRPLAAQLGDLVAQITVRSLVAAEGKLLLHAGAVARSDGAVAVLCGPSGSGKSTLTVRLVELGLSYVTDETVCVDPDTARVQPYRKPVSLKLGSQSVLPHLRHAAGPTAAGTWLIPPSALEASPMPTRPLTADLLVFPTFSPGEPHRVEPLTQGEAAFLLGRNSSQLARVRPRPLSALARLTRRAPAFRIVHSNLDAAARTVRELWAA